MWIWLGVIAGLLILIVVLVLLSNIHIRLQLSKLNHNDKIMIEVRAIYGIIKYKYEIPFIVFKDYKSGFIVENEQSNNMMKDQTSEKKQNINKQKIQLMVEQFKKILKNTDRFLSWFNQTLSHVKVTKLTWSTRVGLEGAAETATIAGLLWGLKAALVGYMSYRVRLLKTPELQVVPLFHDKPQFSTEIVCIAKISCGYAIYAGLVLIVRVLKVKGGVKQWQNILFKA
ncbi:DUF2953 domain-containing protein [Paenibacillus sediminis]|uniref:DUF2953 domain-containing protein n=1 Tax=Paenibacillus sediminis TaxID=664909 RepID=A0ABS4GZL4_9BACL|nr:hypothetical protein [Paenibacillus sediminis]